MIGRSVRAGVTKDKEQRRQANYFATNLSLDGEQFWSYFISCGSNSTETTNTCPHRSTSETSTNAVLFLSSIYHDVATYFMQPTYCAHTHNS